MIDGVPYDPTNPPAEPPAGCVDPVLWRVAFALYRAHHPRLDNFCECKVFWPCPDALLAGDALKLACDRSMPRPRSSRAANPGRWTA